MSNQRNPDKKLVALWLTTAQKESVASRAAAAGLNVSDFIKRQLEIAEASAPDPRENHAHGNAAFRRVVETHGDELAAMFRASIGYIDFLWGKVGDPERGFIGGEGVAHVLAKHPEAVSRIPGVIAFGDVYDDDLEDGKFYIVKSRRLVVLRKRRGCNHYLVTGYEADNPDKIKQIRRRNRLLEKGE